MADKETSAEIRVNEHAFVELLTCADGYAKKLDHEGYSFYADKIRALVRNNVFNINHQFGFEKYYYDRTSGVKDVVVKQIPCNESEEPTIEENIDDL